MNITHYIAAMIGLGMGWAFNGLAQSIGYGSLWSFAALTVGCIPFYFLADNANLRKNNDVLRDTICKAADELERMHSAVDELKATVASLETK